MIYVPTGGFFRVPVKINKAQHIQLDISEEADGESISEHIYHCPLVPQHALQRHTSTILYLESRLQGSLPSDSVKFDAHADSLLSRFWAELTSDGIRKEPASQSRDRFPPLFTVV